MSYIFVRFATFQTTLVYLLANNLHVKNCVIWLAPKQPFGNAKQRYTLDPTSNTPSSNFHSSKFNSSFQFSSTLTRVAKTSRESALHQSRDGTSKGSPHTENARSCGEKLRKTFIDLLLNFSKFHSTPSLLNWLFTNIYIDKNLSYFLKKWLGLISQYILAFLSVF